MPDQLTLFQRAPTALPDGFRYEADLLDRVEARALVAEIERLPFKAFQFHGFEGKRRVVALAGGTAIVLHVSVLATKPLF
jgi:hypothetical protein